MTENKRKKQHNDLECVQVGFANGIAPGFPLTEREKWDISYLFDNNLNCVSCNTPTMTNCGHLPSFALRLIHC